MVAQNPRMNDTKDRNCKFPASEILGLEAKTTTFLLHSVSQSKHRLSPSSGNGVNTDFDWCNVKNVWRYP